MTKRILSGVALAVVIAVLGPLAVTTSAAEVNCRVPFAFSVRGETMPAGFYSVSTTPAYMVIRGLGHHSAIALAIAGSERAGGQARLVFLKIGDRYDLSEVWSGDGAGLQIPASPRQLEDRRASNATPERVVVFGDVAAGSR